MRPQGHAEHVVEVFTIVLNAGRTARSIHLWTLVVWRDINFTIGSEGRAYNTRRSSSNLRVESLLRYFGEHFDLLIWHIIGVLLKYCLSFKTASCLFRRKIWPFDSRLCHELVKCTKELRIVSQDESLLLCLLLHYQCFIHRLSLSRKSKDFRSNRWWRERICLPQEVVFGRIAPRN